MKLYKILVYIVLTTVFVACDNLDKIAGPAFDNSVYLDVAAVKSTSNVVFKKTVTDLSRELIAVLTYPAPSDIDVTFAADPSLVADYNRKHETALTMLDKSYYDFSSTKTKILAGKSESPVVLINFKGLDQLAMDETHLLPITIADACGISILGGSKTIFYLVKRSSAITTAADLTPTTFMMIPNLDTKEGCVVMNNLGAVTYEAIINIHDFDKTVNISSIMGVEQHLLLRFGDVGFPRQQIQAQIGGDKLPKKNAMPDLQPNQWYHIALTWDLASKAVCFYLNGELVSQGFASSWKGEKINLAMRGMYDADPIGNASLAAAFQFMIGYSYDRSRPLNGLVSEVRVWSVARTAQQIWDCMYDVDSQSPGLCAYWKFNEGKGNVVKDQTGRGNDAVCMDCSDPSGSGGIVSGTLSWNNSIEVPMLNSK